MRLLAAAAVLAFVAMPAGSLTTDTDCATSTVTWTLTNNARAPMTVEEHATVYWNGQRVGLMGKPGTLTTGQTATYRIQLWTGVEGHTIEPGFPVGRIRLQVPVHWTRAGTDVNPRRLATVTHLTPNYCKGP